jgi:hypothetical protein
MAKLARRTHPKTNRLAEVLAEVERRFKDGPLACIRELIEPDLTAALLAIQDGQLSLDLGERLALKTERFIAHLPGDFGPRFKFDFAMISAVCEEWGRRGTSMSKMIIPSSFDEWAHLGLTYAQRGRACIPVDLILFPGAQTLDGVNLLAYPFLCHELGHNVLFKHDHIFGGEFKPRLDAFANSLQRRSIADQGAARQRAQTRIDELRRYWEPAANHNNWSHEIAVDVVALWTCGPAYLAAFQDVLDEESLDPYQIDQSHPPYEVRADALLSACDGLGWASYTSGIRNRMDAWRASDLSRKRTNSYLASTSAELTRECVDSSMKVCDALGLPCCTPEGIASLDARLQNGYEPDFGTELILSAWLRWNQLGEGAYEEWETDVKASLCNQVTL